MTGVSALLILILNSYLFKFIVAALDTPLFYLGAWVFRAYEEDPSGHSLFEQGATRLGTDGDAP